MGDRYTISDQSKGGKNLSEIVAEVKETFKTIFK